MCSTDKTRAHTKGRRRVASARFILNFMPLSFYCELARRNAFAVCHTQRNLFILARCCRRDTSRTAFLHSHFLSRGEQTHTYTHSLQLCSQLDAYFVFQMEMRRGTRQAKLFWVRCWHWQCRSRSSASSDSCSMDTFCLLWSSPNRLVRFSVIGSTDLRFETFWWLFYNLLLHIFSFCDIHTYNI